VLDVVRLLVVLPVLVQLEQKAANQFRPQFLLIS
jgi:CRISPR/Cas system-associated protein endoribonuclease Cas2